MTDESKAALQQAIETMSAARSDADRETRACLEQIANDLPTRASEIAKRIAIDQPEVTKSLGKEGVAEMRSDLQGAAEELGRQFIAAGDEIEWPLGTSYTKVENRHIHSALFHRFYRRTTELSDVLNAKGYRLGDSDPFIPQALYTESKFTPLAAALTALGVATESSRKAKKADDDAAVEDLWGD